MRALRWTSTVLAATFLGALVAPKDLQGRTESTSEQEGQNPEFERVIDRYLAEFHGVGERTGPPDDGSIGYYRHQLDKARELLAQLQQIDRDSLSFDQDIDYRYLEGILKSKVMDGERVKRWQQDPRIYIRIEPIISARGGLLHDELRPLDERAERILEVLRIIPARLTNGKKNLTQFIRLWLEPSKAELAGNIQILEKDLPRFADRVEKRRATLLAESQKVLAALRDFGGFLATELPQRLPGDWRVGRDIFDFRLRQLHHIEDMDAESFYEWGRREYREQLHTLELTASRLGDGRTWRQIELDLQADHPKAEALIYEHIKAVRRNREWVLEKDLVSFPWDQENAAISRASPAVYSNRGYGNGGAPRGFGSTAPGGWSVVPVDPRWSPEKREEFLRGHSWAMINAMVTHEVYPGHGLVQLYLNHNPRKLRTYESSYANQAWCYYVEWVLTPQHGFYPPEKQKEYMVEMERNKLWRYARVIADAGMHTGKVSFDEALQLMHQGVLFSERFAFIQVERTTGGGSGNSIPTWGYHQILQLRDDYFARMSALGRKGTLKDFHDRVLQIGMVPVDMIRETLFHQIDREHAATASGFN